MNTVHQQISVYYVINKQLKNTLGLLSIYIYIYLYTSCYHWLHFSTWTILYETFSKDVNLRIKLQYLYSHFLEFASKYLSIKKWQPIRIAIFHLASFLNAFIHHQEQHIQQLTKPLCIALNHVLHKVYVKYKTANIFRWVMKQDF